MWSVMMFFGLSFFILSSSSVEFDLRKQTHNKSYVCFLCCLSENWITIRRNIRLFGVFAMVLCIACCWLPFGLTHTFGYSVSVFCCCCCFIFILFLLRNCCVYEYLKKKLKQNTARWRSRCVPLLSTYMF